MRKIKLDKRKKIIIAAVSTAVLIMICLILFLVLRNKEIVEIISYEDKFEQLSYFEEISIDLTNKAVKKDGIETTLKDIIDISEEQEKSILASRDELANFFMGTTYDLRIENDMAYINNTYQTKKLIVLSKKKLKKNFEAKNQEQILDDLYVLTYDSQMKTKYAYEQFMEKGIEVLHDEISYIENINDISQTVYGSSDNEENAWNSWGLTAMGLDNYKNIINENQNSKTVIVATVGYGFQIDNEFFGNRIEKKAYNFMEGSRTIEESIPQGSRIAEVIVDSTTDNVKILPVVIVNKEGYTNISSIVKGIVYSTINSDVICYELMHNENKAINKALENAFKENKPVCCVGTNSEQKYPANSPVTIATSSLDRNKTITDYSDRGDYIDFAASSTDVKEIFNVSSTVSRWSGAQYANANIAAAIALIKSYDKDFNILEVYNFLRNFCEDLGEEGKDELYGYGMPNFKDLTIANIDKESPQISEVSCNDEEWEKSKKVKIVAKDNIRIKEWQITDNETQPAEWNTLESVSCDLNIETEVTSSGKYYIWVADTAGNIQNQTIEIHKVDSTAPTINYTIDNSTLEEGYVTINVTAEDKESGLGDLPYSWDNSSWGATLNTLKVTANGIYNIYVKDKMDNMATQEIKINTFANEGTADIGDGILIKKIHVSSDWNGDTNNNVQITFNNNIKIVGWQITTDNIEPNYFNSINLNVTEQPEQNEEANSNNTNTIDSENTTVNNENTMNTTNTNNFVQASSNLEITATLSIDTDYHIWVKDMYGSVYTQSFKINKVQF